MKQVKDENYFVVFGWMRALGLKGLQLELYAIIYGFSQDSAGAFYGTLSYLEELTGFNKRTLINNLNEMAEKGLIVKEQEIISNMIRNKYICTPRRGGEENSRGVNFLHGGSEENSRGVVKNLHGGGEFFSPNNKEYNKDINIKDNNLPPISPLTKNFPSGEAIPLPYTSEEFRNTWEVLCRQPKWKKKSKDALRGSLKMLQRYPENIAIRMMENSINNGWRGLFALSLEDLQKEKMAAKRGNDIAAARQNIEDNFQKAVASYEERTGEKFYKQ